MQDLPKQPGIEPMPPVMEGQILYSGPPGKSLVNKCKTQFSSNYSSHSLSILGPFALLVPFEVGNCHKEVSD